MTLKKEINAILTIAARDVTKLVRDRARLIMGLIFPVIFIGVLGSSMQANLAGSLGYNFLTFVFIGVIAQSLFQSTAAGIISLLEDRQTDFAQEMFISPISRYSIIVGKIVGETLVSFLQVFGILLFGFIFRVPFDYGTLPALLPIAFIASLLGGAFGLIVMANVGEQRTAQQIFPFLLFPQFFLAGVFNPIKVLPLPLFVLSRIAPMTYAVDLMRSIYYWGTPEYDKTVLLNPFLNVLIVSAMTIIFIAIGTLMFVKNERNR